MTRNGQRPVLMKKWTKEVGRSEVKEVGRGTCDGRKPGGDFGFHMWRSCLKIVGFGEFYSQFVLVFK